MDEDGGCKQLLNGDNNMKNTNKLIISYLTMALSLCCMGGLYIVSNVDASTSDLTLVMDIQDTTQPQYILTPAAGTQGGHIVRFDDGTEETTKKNTAVMHTFSTPGMHKVRVSHNLTDDQTVTLNVTNNLCLKKAIMHTPGIKIKYQYCSNLETIIFKSSCGPVSLLQYAANACTNLKTFSAPSTTNIGHQAFQDCVSLKSLDFPQAITINNYIVYRCYALKSFSATNAIYIGDHAFRECTSLTEVNLPKVETLSTYAFYQCSSLATLSLPRVIEIKGSGNFSGTALTRLELTSITTEQVSSKASTWGIPSGCTVICSDGTYVRP